ncbi:MAG: hypothetical protein QXU98_12695 [Candidatus Parvarchaeota archaeon]
MILMLGRDRYKSGKKENWVLVENTISNDQEKKIYVNTIPTKQMVYFIGEKDTNGIMKIIKADKFEYLPKEYQDIIRAERAKYLEKEKEKEKEKLSQK